MMELRPYQLAAQHGLLSWFAAHDGNPLVVMPTGCHAENARILMHDGTTKLVQDVQVGDMLMGPDSKPRCVLRLVRGYDMLHRITPKKGTSFIVNEDHKLSLALTNEGKPKFACYKNGTEIETVCLRDWLKASKNFKHLRKLRRVAVDFPAISEPLIPGWHMGVLLGDGSLKHNVCVTCENNAVATGIVMLATLFNVKIRYASKKNNKAFSIYFSQRVWSRSTPNPIVTHLKTLGLWGCGSGCKFIPNIYKLGSRQMRLDVLAGLIDTDGSFASGIYDYISKSRQLADDVVFIARSLGFASYVKSCQKLCQTGNGGEYFRVSVSGNIDEIPVRLAYKKAASRLQKKSPLKTSFTTEPVGYGKFYGFTLDGDHLYLTDDFTVHHNSGKSLCIASFLRSAVQDWPDTRALLLSHVQELLLQDHAALMQAWPDAPAGVYSAGLNRRDIDAQILVAGIQSIHKRAYEVQRCDLVIIDEAHLIGRNSQGMYRRFLAELKEINPHLKVIGYTATPYRTDTGRLDEGPDRLFDAVAHEVLILPLIEQGYLCPVVPKGTLTRLDVSNVGSRGGEFIPSQLEAAVDVDAITTAAVDEIVQAGDNCGSWLLFCAGVGHAKHVRDEVRKWGIACETVTGETPGPERNRLLREFKAGQLRALTSVGVLTTGFDAPGVDLIALLRPTQSVSLHVQMLGRGTRTAPGKECCKIMDFAGNTMRHGCLDQIDGRKKSDKDPDAKPGQAPAKECPACKTIVAASTLQCACGHEFPPPKPMLSSVSFTAPLLSTQIRLEWIDVQSVRYGRHPGRDGKPDSLIVTYQCGLIQHREWVCLEHTGYPRIKAAAWWQRRAPGQPVPNTVADALEQTDNLPTPVALCAKPVGKYVEIEKVRFS